MRATIEIVVNGTRREVETDPARTLLEVLRDDLGLTGTKYGCGEGQCGACTVHVDGEARRSCLVGIGSVAGKSVRTIEGLAQEGRLHPVQQAFIDAGAFQCGYCTPGMVMSAVALLQKRRQPDEADVIATMNGNICRCGVHPQVLAAIRKAASAPGSAPR